MGQPNDRGTGVSGPASLPDRDPASGAVHRAEGLAPAVGTDVVYNFGAVGEVVFFTSQAAFRTSSSLERRLRALEDVSSKTVA